MQAHVTQPGPLAGAGSVARWGRPLAVGLTALCLLWAVVALSRVWTLAVANDLVAVDHLTLQAFAQRWLDTGSMYLPYQVAGPFDPRPLPHVPSIMPSMYPPHAVYLFVPSLVLPAILWWAIPFSIIGYALWRWRPAVWTWPVLVLLLADSDSLTWLVVGSSTMWTASFVAAGLLWSWPAVLVTLKPSLLPFALIGIRRRSWWIASAGLAVLSLPLAGQWMAYASVVQNAEASLSYSLGSLPLMLVPVVAWLGRRQPRSALVTLDSASRA